LPAGHTVVCDTRGGATYTVEGSTSDLSRFFGYFDPPAEDPPNVVLR
jgi:hypothetical protein